MGTSITGVGNHKITFKDKSFSELATEIKTKLDSLVFVNADFLRSEALRDKNMHPDYEAAYCEMNFKKEWEFFEDDEYFRFKEYKTIEFYGPFEL